MLLAYYLILFRVANFGLIVLAVIYFVRHHRTGDPRHRPAALAGLAVALAALGSVLFRTALPLDRAGLQQLGSDLLSITCLGPLIWMVCCGGMLIGDGQGGYWVKRGTRFLPAARACLLGTGLSLAFSVPFFVVLGEPLAPELIPVTGAEWGGYLCKISAHSFGEEVFFRGWAMAGLAVTSLRCIRFKPWSANLVIAAIFAVGHSGGPYQMLTAFWSGLIMGVVFQRYGLIAAASLHLGLNLIAPAFQYLT